MFKKALRCQAAGWAVGLVFLLAGCTVTLAPRYDQAVMDGLVRANASVMEFFASISGGTEPGRFDQRQDGYNRLIGGFDALTLQARARPVPQGKVLTKINERLAPLGVAAYQDGETASTKAMAGVARILTKMKSVDQKQGLTPLEVEAFKNQVMIYLDQALMYENFLKG